jgi:hypothetical protein
LRPDVCMNAKLPSKAKASHNLKSEK